MSGWTVARSYNGAPHLWRLTKNFRGLEQTPSRCRLEGTRSHQRQGAMLREVAHTYYSPNPQHSVWEGDKVWAIYVADPAHLATHTDVDIDEEFTDLNQNLIDRGMDNDAA